MKNKILQLLTSPPEDKGEFFNEALLLYTRSQNVPQHQLRHFNANGFSNARLESLIYELKKLHGISDADLVLFETPVVVGKELEIPVEGEQTVTGSGDEEEGTDDIILTLERKLKELKEQSITGSELSEQDLVANTAVTPAGLFETAPDTVKEDIKLREEFPFLKDINCPDELKVLVADKMTHYAAFVDAHRSLLVIVPGDGQEPVALSADEIYELAKKAVENFTINQDIYAELEHYKNEGTILGQHPKLRRLKMIESINNATPLALSKRLSNLKNYINRETATLKKTTDTEDKLKIEKKIEGYKEEQELVKAKLVPDDKK